jgi:hypothetical protein
MSFEDIIIESFDCGCDKKDIVYSMSKKNTYCRYCGNVTTKVKMKYISEKKILNILDKAGEDTGMVDFIHTIKIKLGLE